MPDDAVTGDDDTIVAIATPAGAGGVGIVRLSGPRSRAIAEAVAARALLPRQAHYADFRDAAGDIIDDGIALFFAGPASYTGEDVVELQAHGSPVVLRGLVERCCELGARAARAGEFSERAFRNGKLDLAQAEAVADLIAASDVRAARAARRSLEGGFSRRAEALAAELLALRVHVEAAIDFADEPIQTLGGAQLRSRLATALVDLDALLVAAERGRRLRDGLHAVIVGPPNAGKSSLLNALAGSERAIVTDVAGTTRDLLQESVRLDGVELTLVDTAGLREGGDEIEREGMRRARAELERADLAIVVLDARDPDVGRDAVAAAIAGVPRRLWLYNKADLLERPPGPGPGPDSLYISVRTGVGLEPMHATLRELGGAPAGEGTEGAFSARARHVDALRRARGHAAQAAAHLREDALELAAEALRGGHDAVGELTGRIAAEDLLGHVFASFCIGK
jgi:tRNA modification GTPase